MLLEKGDGSSPCKGKEIVTDYLPTKTMGEETPHSELDYPKEEEGGCGLDNECPRLIDPCMALISTSPWYLVTIRLRHRAACGFLFSAVTRRFLGPLWLPLFPILTSTKKLHYLCLFSSNFGWALFWVGKNRWIRSCPMWVS